MQRTLKLNRTTVRILTAQDLSSVHGGETRTTVDCRLSQLCTVTRLMDGHDNGTLR